MVVTVKVTVVIEVGGAVQSVEEAVKHKAKESVVVFVDVAE